MQPWKALSQGEALSGSEGECVFRMGKGGCLRSEAGISRLQEVNLSVPKRELCTLFDMNCCLLLVLKCCHSGMVVIYRQC